MMHDSLHVEFTLALRFFFTRHAPCIVSQNFPAGECPHEAAKVYEYTIIII
jgi:hypothetical protein